MNEAVAEFRSAAQRYWDFVEREETGGREFCDGILERLAALYAAGCRLPHREPATEDDLPDRPTIEEAAALAQRIGDLVGPRNVYWLVEPYEARPEKHILAGGLSDDLSAIWRDVKQGLLALEGGAPEDDVVWDWWFGLDAHWGRHAVEALTALHKLRTA